MDIIILLSPKGGIGKTLTALATTIWFVKRKMRRVLAVDLSWTNPDFSRVLALTEMQKAGDYTFWRPHDDLFVLRPRFYASLPDGTPGFWRRIQESVTVATSEGFFPQHVVVDTSVHAPNIVAKDKEEELRNFIGDFTKTVREEIGGAEVKLKYWVFWTFAVLSDEETWDGLENLYDLNQGIDPSFGHGRLSHIMNVQSMYPYTVDVEGFLRSMVGGRSIPMGGLARLATASIDNTPISVGDFREIIITALDNCGPVNDTTQARTLLSNVAQQILVSRGNKRPVNVYSVPTYDGDLASYTDLLGRRVGLSTPDLEHIEQRIKRFVEIFGFCVEGRSVKEEWKWLLAPA